MKLKYLLTLFMLIPLMSFSQSGKVWTLEECIVYALDNNIQVKQSELTVRQTKLSEHTAVWNRLPNLNGSTGYRYTTGRSINPFTNVIENNDISSQSFSINSSVTVFNYFAINNRVKQSKIDSERSIYDLENTKNTTILNIVTFYTNILLNDEQVKNSRLAVQTSQLQLNRVNKQFEVGAIARQNVLQIEQQLANDELLLVQAENALQFAKLNLQQAMQLPTTSNFEIFIPELPDPSEDFAMDSPDVIYEQALLTQPNIKSVDASVESSEYGVKISEADYYPSLTLSAGIGTSYSSVAPDEIPAAGSPNVVQEVPIGFVQGSGDVVVAPSSVPVNTTENTYFNQLDFNRNSAVSLNLSIPIFNKFQVRNNVATQKITLERALLTAQNERNVLRQTIEQVYQDAVAASKSFKAAKNQVNALEESFRNVETRFNLGSADPVEYNQIKNDLNRAQADLTRAKYDFIFKLKILDFYQGKPLTLEN